MTRKKIGHGIIVTAARDSSIPGATRASPRPASAAALLNRILGEPALVAAVQQLAPAVLGRLIGHVGLEDAGELVALATTEQLQAVFDEDLWGSEQAGEIEKFDPERFALWLEVLLEMGPAYAAARISEMDEDFFSLGLSRHILVIDIEELAVRMSSARNRSMDDELFEKAIESGLNHEFEQYRVYSRTDHWDAVLNLLLALDEQHHDFLMRLLDRCAAASADYIDDNGGLYEVLTSAEMLESDAGSDRESRREREGFVPAQDARAFLELARVTPLREILSAKEADVLTRAHFRTYDPEPARKRAEERIRRGGGAESRLLALMAGAGVTETGESLRLSGPDTSAETPLARALSGLFARDPALSSKATSRLNYLANILVAGCDPGDGMRFRPMDAAEAVLLVCDLGWELSGRPGRPGRNDALLDDLVKLFRAGWNALSPGIAAGATPLEKIRKAIQQARRNAGSGTHAPRG